MQKEEQDRVTVLQTNFLAVSALFFLTPFALLMQKLAVAQEFGTSVPRVYGGGWGVI